MIGVPTQLDEPLAHDKSSSSTRLGTAAAEADQNGASTTAATNPRASSSTGSWTNASARKHAAPARSDAIITRLRLKRSPSMPPSGANTPETPNVSSSDAESHAAEPVRS
jgi:hypothetical protein